jgi:hypothetical protein
MMQSPRREGNAMVQLSPEPSPEAMAAVARLSTIIADPEMRRAFVTDPSGTLERAGVNAEYIPQRLLETLMSLGEDELEVLARMCEDLTESGFYVEVSGNGRVCWY